MSRNRSFRKSIFGGVAIGALCLSAPAWAQEADVDTDTAEEAVVEIAEAAPEGEARQERITVTGSLLSRSEFSSASPIQVITADVAALEGLVDSASILQGSSIASGSTQINNQFAGFVVDGGTGVNTVDLRGCGATRTLVLVNGKRPGPAGTRGAVGSFDLNNMPGSIVQRYDILKDSGSTIYGSDAVCGVVNIITRTSVDKPELNFTLTQPFESGGEQFGVNGAYGFNFDSGSIALAAAYTKDADLSVGDRDYLDCREDGARNDAGDSLDRVNLSANRAADRRNCNNIYQNTAIDQAFGSRYIPSPDGRVVPGRSGAILPGYRPRENGLIPGDALGRSFYEDILTNDRQQTQDAINERELISIYGVADFDFNMLGGVNSVTEVLYTNRKTKAEGWRQFFPSIRGLSGPFGTLFQYANDPTYVNPLNTAFQPVVLWPSNTEIDANYFYAATTLSGDFAGSGFLDNFAWSIGGNYSKSDADYTRNQILASQSGDWTLTDDAPFFDPISADFLAGNYSLDTYNRLTGIDTGNTEYEQWLVNGNIAGEVFDLPAGAVGFALGFEHRDYSINDVPGEFTQSGDIWGSSTAGITTGTDKVSEVFAEVEIPLLKGQPFAEELTFNISGRAFDYDSFGSDSIYKMGLNWQLNPAMRLRATKGTSFRAPALFERFLDAQTSFIGQGTIDPCINYADPTINQNANISANCAADGIPGNYTGLGSSARVIAGGNGDTLAAETSESFTVGAVFTPTFADFNVAVDYFEFEVDDQIGQLGAASILAACYGGDPAQFANNAFCDLFTREPAGSATSAFAIIDVNDQFLNIDSQVQRGIDVEVRYERDFDFGSLTVDGGGTWTLESLTSLFAPGTVDGVENNDSNGSIGDPSFVADARISLDRGDWTYTWFSNYVGNTSNARFDPFDNDGQGVTYFGLSANFDYTAEAVIYHGASVRWSGDTWTLTGGVRNIFDEHPSTVAARAATLRGQVPLVATQYDLRGRRAFVQVSKTF